MFITTFTATPQIGETFRIDRPDWVATGHITEVNPHQRIAGHNGTSIVWQVDPNQFDIIVNWDINSGDFASSIMSVRVEG